MEPLLFYRVVILVYLYSNNIVVQPNICQSATQVRKEKNDLTEHFTDQRCFYYLEITYWHNTDISFLFFFQLSGGGPRTRWRDYI